MTTMLPSDRQATPAARLSLPTEARGGLDPND